MFRLIFNLSATSPKKAVAKQQSLSLSQRVFALRQLSGGIVEDALHENEVEEDIKLSQICLKSQAPSILSRTRRLRPTNRSTRPGVSATMAL